MKTIGIIGGVGPLATTLYYRALVDRVVVATQGLLPEIFLYSLPIDSEVERAFICSSFNGDNCISEKVRSLMLRSLEIFIQNQIKAVAMPCNTLQPLLEDICEIKGIHNINLVGQTVEQVFKDGFEHVLIIGTTSTCKGNEYGKSLTQLGVRYKYLSEDDQVLTSKHIISSLRTPHSSSPYLPQLVDCIARACRDVDGLIIGCTDLANHLTSDMVGVPVIDSLQVLIDRSIDYIFS